jgi:hypothetical protein
VCSPDAQPSATIRNISQPFATVRRRPCEFAMAVPLGSAAKVVTFRILLEGSNVAQRRFVWQAWHFVTFHNMFHTVSKIVPCDMRKLLCRFWKMSRIFRGRSCCVASAALRTCGVACFLRIALSVLRQW